LICNHSWFLEARNVTSTIKESHGIAGVFLIVHSLIFSILIISTYCNYAIYKSECTYMQSQHLQPSPITSQLSNQFCVYLNIYVAMLAWCQRNNRLHACFLCMLRFHTILTSML